MTLDRLRALSARGKIAIAAGAVAGIAVAATFAIPGQVTWSDAHATTTLVPV